MSSGFREARVQGHGAGRPWLPRAQGVQQQLAFSLSRCRSVRDNGDERQAVVTVDRADLADIATKVGGVTIGNQRLIQHRLAAAATRVVSTVLAPE
jgi:hypothetical protein